MKIAISGAGIAGPTLAYWLRRVGHEPTLIERAPRFRTGGYVIDFWGNGYRVGQRMGLESAIRDAGYQIRSLRSVGSDGGTRASLSADVFRRATDGDFTSVARGDLAAVIYSAVRDDVESIFGDSITTVEQDAGGVCLTFAEGVSREFDLVIGADGLHSNVRKLTLGTDSHAMRYLGCMVSAWVVDGYRPRDEAVYVTYSRPGRSAARFSLRGDRTLFLLVFRADEGADPGSVDAQKALLWRMFGDAGWECEAILRTLEGVDDLYFDVVSQVHLPRWTTGRVALIGDAAACISLLGGEGTGLAMTAAYVLAGELMQSRGDHRQAFAAYEAKLRPFIHQKQLSAKKFISVFATKTELGIAVRHLVMRAMKFHVLGDLLVARSLRDDFALPDYPM
jgi:2-polyprenyl-6-methoxyphenol hydroxylase-like FAD-dependent oxidoreductase